MHYGVGVRSETQTLMFFGGITRTRTYAMSWTIPVFIRTRFRAECERLVEEQEATSRKRRITLLIWYAPDAFSVWGIFGSNACPRFISLNK